MSGWGYLVEALSLLAAVLSLALMAFLMRFVFGSYVVSMREDAFRSFGRSGHLMIVAMVLFAMAMLVEPFDHFTYDLLELGSLFVLLYSVLMFRRYFVSGGGPRLFTRLEWGELANDIGLKEVERDFEEDRAFRRFLSASREMSLVLVEVGEGIAPFPVMDYLYTRLMYGVSSSSAVCAALGPTTPHEFRKHSAQMSPKCNLWVSSSDVRTDWIREKFTILAPSDLTDTVHYFKAVSEAAGRKVTFIGDFMDELGANLSERELQGIISDIHTLMEANGNLVVLVVAKGLYQKSKLAIMERYADGVVRVEGRPPMMSFLDTHSNRTTALGAISLGKK